MSKPSKKRLSWVIAGLFCVQEPVWALSVTATNFGAGPVAPNAPLVIDLDQFPAPADGSLSIFIGTLDVGGLIRATGERQITYPSGEYPLQPGATELIVYLIKDSQKSQEVARIP
ncbi:MAG: hypothetical protein M3Z31_10810, partial [Pseudomonadota bacterium]|nr:hypothetical protein [Pseudomonadota bacterium]